jgi:hypothetical protein
VLPLQQPVGQDAASHTHCPPALQACPAAHPPQLAPPVPHEEEDCDPYASQVPDAPEPVQHPPAHVSASQEQVPLLVSHTPFAHAAHAAPPAPHWEADSLAYATHASAAVQHPPGHEVASHTQEPVAVLHSCPAPQDPHAAPPVPHLLDDSDA